MGLVAAYVGLSAVVLTAMNEAFLAFLWFTATGIGMLVCLLVAQKAMRGRE